MPAPLEAETGKSYSIDVTRIIGLVSLTGTIFGSSVNHALQVERESAYEITNADLSATTAGIELLATMAQGAVCVDRNLLVRAIARAGWR
jgi:hypothetical protein